MFIKNNLMWEKVNTKPYKSVELIQIKLITNNHKSINVNAIYKPKYDSVFMEEMEDIIENIKDRKIIILGDINIDLNDNNPFINKYKNMLAIPNIKIKTKEITRLGNNKNKTTGTHIDHIYTKNVPGKAHILLSNISDHNIISIKAKITIQKQKQIKNYKFQYNSNLIKEIINNTNWQSIEKEGN